MIRQGDVLLVPVEGIPKDAKKVQTGGKIILAYGEATGHHHAVEDLTTIVYHGPEGEVYLDATEHTEVVHQEHAPMTIEKGKYRKVQQRMYTPEAIRNVID